MLKTRLFAVGVSALAAATFALTGCGDNTQPGDSTTTPPTTSAPQTSAKEAFSSAASKLSDESYKTEMTMDGLVNMKSTGQIDPVGKKANLSSDVNAGGVEIKMSILSVNNEVWLKMGGAPGMPDKWMHAAADKVKAGSSLDVTRDGSASLDSAVVEVERDGANGFKGTIDTSKYDGIPDDVVKQLGDKAKTVPFTATVDAEGRLSTFVIDMSLLVPGMGKMTTKYSDFGAPVTVTPPAAADVVEMPAQILDSMNAS